MTEGISRMSLADFHQHSNASYISPLEPDEKTCREPITSEKVQEKMALMFQESFNKLGKLWEKIGFEQEQKSRRSHVLLYHMETILLQIVSEEEELFSRLEDSVTNYSEDILRLCAELGIEQFQPNTSMPMKDLEDFLRLKLDELMEEKERRMKTLADLKQQEIPLCARLRMPSLTLDVVNVPSTEDLKEMAQHLEMLNEEKKLRLSRFSEVKQHISRIMKEMEILPTSTLEIEVLNGHEDAIMLSQEMMATYRDLLNDIKERQLANDELAQNLRSRLTILWQCLNMNKEEQSNVIAKTQGFKLSTIRKLQDEIERCLTIRQQNVTGFIENARDRLKELWKMCCIPENQAEHRQLLTDETGNEISLDNYERAIVEWEEYYCEHSEILSSSKKLEALWDNMKELEEREKDPNRLLNRGGALLQEEKDRRKVEKDIIMMEKLMLKAASDYEKKEEVFKVWGKDLRGFVKELRDCFTFEKRKQQEERRLRSPKLSPSKRHLVDSADPCAKKLKFGTHLRVGGVSPATSDGSGSSRTYLVSPRRKRQASKVRKFQKHLSPAKSPGEKAPPPPSPSVSVTSYTDFKVGVAFSSTVVMPPDKNIPSAE